MSIAMYLKDSEVRRNLKSSLLGLLLVMAPAISTAEIIWSGDFNDQNFLNYHRASDPNEVTFHHMPVYGRPIQYGGQHPLHVGNGDLLSLVSSPTRGSNYSAKFTVKNSTNGTESADCDPATDCTNRRSQIQMTNTFTDYYNALPYHAERWLSFSVYLPPDFRAPSGSWGVVIWGSKGWGAEQSGWLGLSVDNDGWRLIHRFSKTMETHSEWWRTVLYTKDSPSSSYWAQGLVDFPNEAASKAALANLNKGGWTDFILHFKTDVRDVDEGNDGFFNAYMRAGSGSWVHVLNLLPMADVAIDPSWVTTKPERLYDRGIGHLAPDGFGSNMGLYMPKEKVWNNAVNMSVYFDNHKVGNERTTFEMMSHDGSSPDNPGTIEEPRPMPPLISSIE